MAVARIAPGQRPIKRRLGIVCEVENSQPNLDAEAAELNPAADGAASTADEPATDEQIERAGRLAAAGEAIGPTQASEDGDWWDDPAMPWKSKPTRKDFTCLGWIGFLGIFSLCMLPMRAWLLGDPDRLPWLVALLGSRSGTAALGSVIRVGGEQPWIWPLLLGSLMSIKLDWVYWWAGKLWGRGMIEVWAGQSKRAAKNYARAERWAHKLGWLGIFISYVPIPLPIMPVVFVLAGAAGMSIKKFLTLDFLASLVWLIGYFLFGYVVGEPAVAVLEYYAKFANYVAIGLIVFIVIGTFWRTYRQGKVAAGEDVTDADELDDNPVFDAKPRSGKA